MAEIDYGDLARSAMIHGHGPRCAAWLIFHRRADGTSARDALRRNGVYDFVLPDNVKRPTYFAYAVACLAERRWWSVEEVVSGGLVRFRVKWLGWSGWKRIVGVPREIVTGGSA